MSVYSNFDCHSISTPLMEATNFNAPMTSQHTGLLRTPSASNIDASIRTPSVINIQKRTSRKTASVHTPSAINIQIETSQTATSICTPSVVNVQVPLSRWLSRWLCHSLSKLKNSRGKLVAHLLHSNNDKFNVQKSTQSYQPPFCYTMNQKSVTYISDTTFRRVCTK